MEAAIRNAKHRGVWKITLHNQPIFGMNIPGSYKKQQKTVLVTHVYYNTLSTIFKTVNRCIRNPDDDNNTDDKTRFIRPSVACMSVARVRRYQFAIRSMQTASIVNPVGSFKLSRTCVHAKRQTMMDPLRWLPRTARTLQSSNISPFKRLASRTHSDWWLFVFSAL